jgi:hypothetical protein
MNILRGVEDQLILPLLEEVINLLFWDGPILDEDGYFIGEDAGVEVAPHFTAHVSPEEDIPGSQVPLEPPVWDVGDGEEWAAEKLTFNSWPDNFQAHSPGLLVMAVENPSIANTYDLPGNSMAIEYHLVVWRDASSPKSGVIMVVRGQNYADFSR